MTENKFEKSRKGRGVYNILPANGKIAEVIFSTLLNTLSCRHTLIEISVCACIFIGFDTLKTSPPRLWINEQLKTGEVFVQCSHHNLTHIAYAAYYTIKTSRSERENLETHHGVCKTPH